MIWANLLHLGYNMWEDWKAPTPEHIRERAYHTHLRFEEGLWNDITQHMADVGMNMVVIDLGEGVRYESHPEIAVEGSWTPDRLRRELARLREMGLEPIPKLNFSTAHDAWLGEYHRMVSTPTYYAVLRDLIREVAELFDKPRFFHLGMDEETCSHQKFQQFVCVRQLDLWWHDLHYMVDQVEKTGSRPWVWSDYIWDHEEAFLQKMPRSVLQSNWYYNIEFDSFAPTDKVRPNALRLGAYRTLEANGFDQIPTGSNHEFDENMGGTVDYCRDNIAPERLFGFLMTPWRPTIERHRQRHMNAVNQVGEAIKKTRKS